ncbi:Plasma membrane-associated cation-binding protein 1 [Platanthera guangdongensis]|uniref:Plasma membrane-associated cation-binding protein 1 n=1 Tax=Platanthera guangdongensis TaxID=2320717 RepID=A0ABR2N310_9ASPA
MGFWKTKVLPKIRLVFEIKNGSKKAAAEASKSFDDSKEAINKELEEKKVELQPKVLGVYEASSADIKALIKEHTEEGVQKKAAVVTTFLADLVKIDFPGSKQITDAVTKFGAGSVSAPVVFILEKVSTFIPVEEVSSVQQDAGETEREVAVVVEEEKKTEDAEKKVDEGTASTPPASTEEKALPSEAAAAALEQGKLEGEEEAPKA